MKRYVAIWCSAWVGLVESIIEIVSLGTIMLSLRLQAVKFFAKRGWF